MKKTLKGLRNLEELFTEQGMEGLDYLSMSIGYDGKAYFLFSSKIPDRIDGMFVNTVANAEYKAVVVTPSWESGELKKVERINFGRHVMNFRFLRPVPDGSFLLLGSRSFTFGDGIADCIVRDDGLIITSYFDEGVLGNYGWDDPIGSCGLCGWTMDGRNIWRCERDILDCYAMNIDADGNLWYYYYTDFQLVRTDFRTETEYDPMVEGASCFAVAGQGRFLIMDGGYDDPDSFYVSKINGGQIEDTELLEFVREDGTAVPAIPQVFNGAKTIVLAGDGSIGFADFSEMG